MLSRIGITKKVKKCGILIAYKQAVEKSAAFSFERGDSMTEKQKRFCEEYLIDLNGTRAYKAAYSSVKNDNTAAASASELLRNPKVRAYLDERLEQLRSERTADAQEVMEYLTSVMRGESEASVVVVEGIGDGCSTARTVQKPPDEKERLKAAELLGKRFGMFADKVEVSTNNGCLNDILEQLTEDGK